MNKIINLVKLDYMTIMPYKTNLMVMGLFLIIFGSTKVSAAGMGISIAYAAILASYPFSIGEKSHLDALYASLPIKRADVVTGRYLYAFSMQIIIVVLGLASTIISSYMNSGVFRLVLMDFVFALISIVVSSTLVFLQMPIIFKMGYNKSKAFSYIPIAIIILGAVIGGGMLSQFGLREGFTMFVNSLNLQIIGLTVAVIYVALVTVSYKMSVRFYSKRNL